ncbi:MAG: tRNA (adenosine(37)-N6)-threonylcarbamoyltransferase complex ATPase subunit type 1 TsaE, partial [Clostridia bacterium]|nr:tRNA (adenosine(37)-N6)-threonylcarbamoyltransferase complex ATPase subunit type 1 TsaE [Clostridia bacterium]
MKVIVHNIEDTQNIARLIAPKLNGGDILLLKGDLGVGKTTFTKALCEALGVEDMVTSPTFTILNQYNGSMNIN